MISIVKGTAVDPKTLLTDAGVGYEVECVTPLAEGESVTLYTQAVYREDSAVLYGFEDTATRDTFRALLRTNGIGPAMALSMLSKLGKGGVQRVFRDRDDAALADLVSVDGIGAKTAQKLLVSVNIPTEDAEDSPHNSNMVQAKGALSSLGFDEGEIEEALATITDSVTDVGEVVKQALAKLRGEDAA